MGGYCREINVDTNRRAEGGRRAARLNTRTAWAFTVHGVYFDLAYVHAFVAHIYTVCNTYV